MTHLDIDHASGLELVKDAKMIMASPQEIKAAQGLHPRYLKKLWKNIPIKPICYEATGLGPQGLSWDIFGDGSICVIATAGHTAGSFCVLIQGKNQFVLLAGDTGYAPSSWMQMRLPGPLFNKQSMLKSLAWVKTMAESEKCLCVLAGHDPHIKTQMIEL